MSNISIDTSPYAADMPIELRLFRYAVTVADEGSFTRAAERLGIAQPPLSQQIAALEARLGFRLFVRGPGGVVPTAAGRVFVDRARITIEHANDAVDRARLAAEGRTGTLALGLSGASMFSFLPPLLRDYRRGWPGVALHLRNLGIDEQLALLAEGRLDGGFTREIVVPDGFALERVHAEPFVAALPVTHRLARRASIALEELARDEFVLFPDVGSGFHAEVVALCRAAGFVPAVVQTLAPMHAVVGLVGAGLGVSIVPASVKVLAFADVRYVRLRGTARESEQYLAYDPSSMSPVARGFVDFVRERLRAPARNATAVPRNRLAKPGASR